MPRGVYDRSKVKKAAKAVSDVTEEVPKVKRKYTRKASAEGVAMGAVPVLAEPSTGGPGSLYEIQELTRLAQGLAELSASGRANLNGLVGKVAAAIETRFDALYGAKKEEVAAVVVEKPTISLPTPEKFLAATPTAPTA